MTNFNVNNSGTSKLQSRNEKKPETQINFYRDMPNPSKIAHNTSGFQAMEKHNKSKQTYNNNPKKKIQTQASFPDVSNHQGTEEMSASTGFNLQPSELKNGITLDKVLGGGFKKISIFDANLAEFSDKDSVIEEPVVKKKTTRLSTSIDDEEYKNFEIAETENEEDGHYESPIQSKKPKKTQETEYDERTTLPDSNQILDRIQKKYKTRKTKTIYRRKSKVLTKAELSSEQIDTEGTEHEQKNEEAYNYDERGRESILSKNESKSLSPKMANEMKRNRFQSLASDKQKFGVSNTKYTMPNEIFYGLKRVPYDQNDSKSQTQNKFRISTNKFKSTKENLKTDSDDLKNPNNKKPLQIKALLNDFNHVNEYAKERRTEHEYERTTSRSSSVANTDKYLENTRRIPVPGEKVNKYIIEQKLSRENRMINDKIKKTEMEIMQKYSKMFHFNNEESKLIFLYLEN